MAAVSAPARCPPRDITTPIGLDAYLMPRIPPRLSSPAHGSGRLPPGGSKQSIAGVPAWVLCQALTRICVSCIIRLLQDRYRAYSLAYKAGALPRRALSARVGNNTRRPPPNGVRHRRGGKAGGDRHDFDYDGVHIRPPSQLDGTLRGGVAQ